MKIAFYKSTRPGTAGIYNSIVRWWEHGPYSHCELVFSDGMSASSSFEDGGVRFKHIVYNPEHWDFIELPDHLEPAARAWFEAHVGKAYDLWGNIHFLLGFVPASGDKWFCSRAIADALGIDEPWRFGPNALAAMVRGFMRMLQVFGGRF